MLDPHDICFGCMARRGSAEKCPHCGWTMGAGPASPLYLAGGTILNGKYLVGRVLGQGGFGITYLALDLNLEIKIAIKEYLPRDLATRSEGHSQLTVFPGDSEQHFQFGLAKFIDEARKLALFDENSGIVSVRDYFEENGTAYFVMQYMEGLTLKAFIRKRGGRLPLDLTLKIVVPVLKALSAVHGKGMLHRDISPDNIYITRNGQVKLLDFGAARQLTGARSLALSVILKPGYAPEEQYRSRSKQGPYTDVYAAACTMYYSLTGQKPPDALNRLDDDSLKRPSELGVKLTDHVENALLKAMAVRAQDRYQTVADFLKALSSEKKEQTQTATLEDQPVGEAIPALQMDESSSQRATVAVSETKTKASIIREGGQLRRFWLIGLLLLVIAAILASVLFYWRKTHPKTPTMTKKEIRRFSPSDLKNVIDRSKVRIDLKESSDGTGSLRIETPNAGRVRLFHLPDLQIENAALIYQARMKTQGLQGRAFLLVAARQSEGEPIVARSIDSALTGDTDWTTVEVGLYPKAGQRLSGVELDVTVWGRGDVWIHDIRLFKVPRLAGQSSSVTNFPRNNV